ncbi:hypothetical protein Btru_077496 [Bulinus truncatus]|nr:hypothetical protein Btru_077496 [Bulinus truncatus]
MKRMLLFVFSSSANVGINPLGIMSVRRLDENEAITLLENRKRLLKLQSELMFCCESSPHDHAAEQNKSCNRGFDDEDGLSYYPDVFTKVLDDEGLLKYSNPISKIPVLSVCYGFLNSELLTLSLSYMDEKKYRVRRLKCLAVMHSTTETTQAYSDGQTTPAYSDGQTPADSDGQQLQLIYSEA